MEANELGNTTATLKTELNKLSYQVKLLEKSHDDTKARLRELERINAIRASIWGFIINNWQGLAAVLGVIMYLLERMQPRF